MNIFKQVIISKQDNIICSLEDVKVQDEERVNENKIIVSLIDIKEDVQQYIKNKYTGNVDVCLIKNGFKYKASKVVLEYKNNDVVFSTNQLIKNSIK